MTAQHASKTGWIDASAGIAGDMLLGALVDAGADLAQIQRAVDAVVPGSVRLASRTVTRAGLRACHVTVEVHVEDPPHRTWRTIRALLDAAELPGRVRADARATFARLAEAEGRVHGIDAEEVHFHEVGALDSLADVVGVCTALDLLGVQSLSVGEVALGGGEIRAAHGTIPVPVPAVVELARGWRVRAGGPGELTTPTGMALLATLCTTSEDLPALRIASVGVGAGTRDRPGRANITRVVLGELLAGSQPEEGDPAVLLEANVDDLEPRLWPGVLTTLLRQGADDAWLVPILMKKGRPAHTLAVLAPPPRAAALREVMLSTTSTLGVRSSPVSKYALPRTWVPVAVTGGQVRVKVGHRGGVIVQATPEFADVVAVAQATSRTEHGVLAEALAGATAAGLVAGAELPQVVRSRP